MPLTAPWQGRTKRDYITVPLTYDQFFARRRSRHLLWIKYESQLMHTTGTVSHDRDTEQNSILNG